MISRNLTRIKFFFSFRNIYYFESVDASMYSLQNTRFYSLT